MKLHLRPWRRWQNTIYIDTWRKPLGCWGTEGYCLFSSLRKVTTCQTCNIQSRIAECIVLRWNCFLDLLWPPDRHPYR